MVDSSLLIFLLFLSALAIGYLLARGPIHLKSFFSSSVLRSPHDRYREGLNYLIAERPDAAIDALTATLEVNEETLETHMALGAMLRKRGEVDRAIRIHQNILARPSLNRVQDLQARLALAEDYLKAGLFDRAEALYGELSHEDDSEVASVALERLVEVYQCEGEWLQAVVAADALNQLQNGEQADYWRGLQAHFYCEMAEQSLSRNYYADAGSALDKAQSLAPDLVRVVILQGQLALRQNQNTQAFELLKAAPLHFTAHNSQVLPLLIEAYLRTHSDDSMQTFLAELYQQQASALLLPAMARAMAEQSSEVDAIVFLVAEISQWPSLSALNDVLSILPASTYSQLSLESLLKIVELRLKKTQSYDCQSCGYAAHLHHWQCPSCKTWGQLVAIH